jgi:hypothetical protein
MMTAPSGIRALWEKALSLGEAVLSGTDEKLVAERLASCRLCPRIDRSPDGYEYCGACGCGRWPLARLDWKLAFRELECPEGRAGFSNAGQAPAKMEPCKSCGQPQVPLTPLEVGEKVIVAVTLPNEPPDRRPWVVEARRGDVYDVARGRRWLEWLWKLGRKERATIGRSALAREGEGTVSHR